MPAGRPPKPTSLKLIAGNPGKRPINDNEPKPGPIKSLDAPMYLPEYAKEIWDEIAPMLMRVGLLTEADSIILSMGCIAIANYRAATKLAPTDRLVIKGANGQVAVSPALIAQSMAFKQAMIVLRDFGMSPTSRSGIVAGGSSANRNPFSSNGVRDTT